MRNPIYLSIVLTVFTHGVAAHAVTIDNGLAPPNPANVIDHTTYASEAVFVRNSAGGQPTTVAIRAGAVIQDVFVRETSDVSMIGGAVGNFAALDSASAQVSGGVISGQLSSGGNATLEFSGGSVGFSLPAFDNSLIVMTGGGPIGGNIYAHGASTIRIYGTDFRINGQPVPYGPLAQPSGVLTGTLLSGQTINESVFQGGGPYTGTIELVAAEEVPAAGGTGRIVLGAALLVLARSFVRRRVRAR